MAFGAEVTFTGDLISEPHLSYSGEGRARCYFVILVGRTWVNKKTQMQESTTADFGVVLWGSLAENAKASLQEGDRVVVQGRLEWTTFTDEHREEHVRLELLANECGPTCYNATVHVTKNPRREEGGQESRSGVPQSRTAAKSRSQSANNRETAAHARATAGQRRAAHEDDEPF